MALIRVTNVRVQNSNPCQFQDPFRFEITFDCLPPGIKEGTFVPLAQPNRTHSRLWETRPITIGLVLWLQPAHSLGFLVFLGLCCNLHGTALEWKLVYVGSAKEDKYDQGESALAATVVVLELWLPFFTVPSWALAPRLLSLSRQNSTQSSSARFRSARISSCSRPRPRTSPSCPRGWVICVLFFCSCN